MRKIVENQGQGDKICLMSCDIWCKDDARNVSLENMFLWDSFGLSQALPEPRPNDAMLPARISSLWQCILVAYAAARLDWHCNHAAFAKKGRSGCWKISVGRRRFGEVELNRTSLYWGLLLICILSALVLVCRSHESITFHHSWFKTRRISEFRLSAWRCHVVWTQVLFSSYFFNWAAIPSIFFELHKSVQFPRRSSRWLGRQEPHRGSRRWKKIEFASLCRTIHIAQQAWRLNAVGHVNFINFLCIGFRQRKVGWVLSSNPTRNRLNRRELTIWDVKWYDLNSELTTSNWHIYIYWHMWTQFSPLILDLGPGPSLYCWKHLGVRERFAVIFLWVAFLRMGILGVHITLQ